VDRLARRALSIAIYLNDRYELDGRTPTVTRHCMEYGRSSRPAVGREGYLWENPVHELQRNEKEDGCGAICGLRPLSAGIDRGGYFLPVILYVAVLPAGQTLPAGVAFSASGLIQKLGSFGFFFSIFMIYKVLS